MWARPLYPAAALLRVRTRKMTAIDSFEYLCYKVDYGTLLRSTFVVPMPEFAGSVQYQSGVVDVRGGYALSTILIEVTETNRFFLLALRIEPA